MLQYAMRALEGHSVDITFFYVPQIVQGLRYDALGYVERYIIETGKVSQLFAHQIIWNMKANAYKDEDSQIVGQSFQNFQIYVLTLPYSLIPSNQLLTKSWTVSLVAFPARTRISTNENFPSSTK